MKNKVRNLVYILLLAGIVNGCSSTEKTTASFYSVWWSDFVSYFNVYYNAKKEFDKAQQLIYKSSAESGTEINSVFPSVKRGSVGTKELNSAITKATSILQNHPESNLADDALILIGKSYYFLGDLPPAERKFTEVISNYPNSEIVFEATLFLARTYMEQNKTENGLSILNDLIIRTDVPSEVKGEANLILGERLYLSGKYSDAYPYLQKGIENFTDNEAIARAYYLLSKINSIQGDYAVQLTNLNAAKNETSIPATWYLIGVQTIRTNIALNQFEYAQNELDKLLTDDDLISYRKNFVLEQARIYLAKGEDEIAEKSYKEFIQSNQSSTQSATLIPYAYLDLADLRMRYKTNIEVARYFYEKASAGNSLDSAIIKAKSKEMAIKNYLTLKLEFGDLKKLIAEGITVKDSVAKKDTATVFTGDEDIVEKDSKRRNRRTDESADEQEKEIAKSNEPEPEDPRKQFDPPSGFQRDEEDSRAVQQTAGKRTAQIELILDDDELTDKFIGSTYISKFKSAKDSSAYKTLLAALESQYEKLVEYFYFQSKNMDSVITYAGLMEADFPKSNKLARIIYAKSIAYQRLNLESDYEKTMMNLSSEQGSTRFGKEAKSKLGLVDSTELFRSETEKLYRKAVTLFDNAKYDSSRMILKKLESQDSTVAVYPQILFALGYISEKYDKDWKTASLYYSKVQKNYSASTVAKELTKQFAVLNPEVESEKVAAETGETEQKTTPADTNTGKPAAEKTKPGETKFAITLNAPLRFKRQPKLADVSW